MTTEQGMWQNHRLYLHRPHKACAHSLALSPVTGGFIGPLCRLRVCTSESPPSHCSERGKTNENSLEDTGATLEYETGFQTPCHSLHTKGTIGFSLLNTECRK